MRVVRGGHFNKLKGYKSQYFIKVTGYILFITFNCECARRLSEVTQLVLSSIFF